MIIVKKTTLRNIIFLTLLALSILLALLLSPAVRIALAREPGDEIPAGCGDGVCDPTIENNDLCPEDCQCTDNGVVDPGEGCGCKDVVCDYEPLSSACGTFAGENGECPSKLQDDGTTKSLSEWYGVCWDACECEGKCTEEDEDDGDGDGSCSCPDFSGGGTIDTGCPDTEANPCDGGFTRDGTWQCVGTGDFIVDPRLSHICCGVIERAVCQ